MIHSISWVIYFLLLGIHLHTEKSPIVVSEPNECSESHAGLLMFTRLVQFSDVVSVFLARQALLDGYTQTRINTARVLLAIAMRAFTEVLCICMTFLLLILVVVFSNWRNISTHSKANYYTLNNYETF